MESKTVKERKRVYRSKWWANLSEERKYEMAVRRREQYRQMREQAGYRDRSTRPRQTLCWSCQRAVKECPWSANFEPVPGWEAEETVVASSYCPTPSYHVIKCPLYEPDP